MDIRQENRNIENIYPLSPMQEGLLFHALLAPESEVYFEQVSCTLSGAVDVENFQCAWKLVLDRHAALRTCFYWKNHKRPLQVVRKQCALPWLESDWRGIAESEREARLNDLLSVDRQQGFDLSTAPLMRCTLVRLSETEYQFVWSHHHLILDGWSGAIIVEEVFKVYECLCEGSDPALSPIRPYQDYIRWIDKRKSGDDETFWKQTLEGFSAPTQIRALNGDAAREGQATEYAEHAISLSPAATSALRELAQRNRLTLNILVQGSWALLLSRYSGDRDLVFGSTVAGRPPELPDVESMVGVFINAIPVRVRVPGTSALLPWLKQLMAEQVEREQHAHSSLVEIQKWSDVCPGEPLFESLVIFESYPLREINCLLKIGDLRLFRQSNYPLTLVAVPYDALHLAISFDTSRFAGAAIERMLRHLRQLLERILENTEQRICEVDLLSRAERQQLAKRNDTTAPYPADLCIHQLFQKQVSRTPETAAVVLQLETLTYLELQARSNQLAHHLRGLGVGPDTLVGLWLERSVEMVVALLGILKAGGAYLPLDPTYPTERLAFMLEDAGVSVLLSQERFEDDLPSTWAQVVLLDVDRGEIEASPQVEVTQAGVLPDHLAYVIYTSGSTGKPKGVQVTHRGLCNLAVAQQKLFTPRTDSRVLQFSSLSFDASIWEIVMALCSGASLHLGTTESLLPGPALAGFLEREKITHMTLPPSALEALPDIELPALQTLIVAGEACAPAVIDRWAPGRRIFNAYGPTESTVCATAWLCRGNGPHPIGHPLPNTRTYVLDRDLNPLPVGISGELYVGGISLARGYLNRPRLTAERFVPDAVSGQSGARLYSTGDLAAVLAAGALTFLGRVDHQVKVRGHRIELEEIEANLTQTPGVKQSVVVVRKNARGNSSLVAYVVAESGGDDASLEIDSASLRSHLQEHLPEYMVPTRFVTLGSLPLSPNGKVDRQALPDPETEKRMDDHGFSPPRDILEQQLVRLWEEILEVHPIGVEDNFFLLGGHSLLAVRLMVGIEQSLGQNWPMATLFQNPTIERLANILRQETITPEWSSLVAVQSAGSRRPFFCVPGGGGNVVYFYALSHILGLDRPFYALQARGLDGRSEPHGTIDEMAAAYIREIRAMAPNGPYLLGGHSSGSWVAYEMANQLVRDGQEVAMLAVIDTPAPIPETRTADVDADEALYLTRISRLIERWAGKDLGLSYEELSPLAPDEQMDYLGQRLKTVAILPPQTSREQVRGLIQVFKASTRSTVRYVSEQVYPGPISLLRASEIHIEDTGIQINLREHDETWGWHRLSSEQVAVHVVPGDHITMLSEPHVHALASQLTKCIETAEGSLHCHE